VWCRALFKCNRALLVDIGLLSHDIGLFSLNLGLLAYFHDSVIRPRTEYFVDNSQYRKDILWYLIVLVNSRLPGQPILKLAFRYSGSLTRVPKKQKILNVVISYDIWYQMSHEKRPTSYDFSYDLWYRSFLVFHRALFIWRLSEHCVPDIGFFVYDVGLFSYDL